MQSRDYDYLTIPASSYEKDAHVSSEEVENYYNKHKKEFMTPEKVSLDYVTLSMHDIKDKIKLSDDDAKRYYEENQSSYLIPASWQVAHILFAVPDDASQSDSEKFRKEQMMLISYYKKIQNNLSIS